MTGGKVGGKDAMSVGAAPGAGAGINGGGGALPPTGPSGRDSIGANGAELTDDEGTASMGCSIVIVGAALAERIGCPPYPPTRADEHAPSARMAQSAAAVRRV